MYYIIYDVITQEYNTSPVLVNMKIHKEIQRGSNVLICHNLNHVLVIKRTFKSIPTFLKNRLCKVDKANDRVQVFVYQSNRQNIINKEVLFHIKMETLLYHNEKIKIKET